MQSIVRIAFGIADARASGEKRHFSTVFVAVHIQFFFFSYALSLVKETSCSITHRIMAKRKNAKFQK